MSKHILTLAAAILIAAAPAYYAFQANAEEAAPAMTPMMDEEGAAVDCSAIADDQPMPAECAQAQTPAAGEKKMMPKQDVNE